MDPDISAEVVLSLDTDLSKIPSPVGSFGFVLSFGKQSFSSAVVPSGSGHLIPGIPEIVQLKFSFLENAAPFLRIGSEFTFFECGRIGQGRIVQVFDA